MSETPDWMTAWQKGQDAFLDNQTKMAEAFQAAMAQSLKPQATSEAAADSGDARASWADQQAAMMQQWAKMWQAAGSAGAATPNMAMPNLAMGGATPMGFGMPGFAPQAFVPQGFGAPGFGAPGFGAPGFGATQAMAGMNPFNAALQGAGGFPGMLPAGFATPSANGWSDFLSNLASGNPFVGTAMAGNPQDWMALMPEWAAQAGMPEAFAAMKALNLPAWWNADMPQDFKQWLDKVAAGPQFADMPNMQAGAARAWKELLDYQQAVGALSAIMSRAWETAYHRFAEAYAESDWSSVDPDKALQDWIKTANTALLEAQRSDAFLDAQRDLMRAGLTLKQRQHEQSEAWCKQANIPSRSEVDDLIDVVHRLRQQLAETRSELAALKGRKRS